MKDEEKSVNEQKGKKPDNKIIQKQKNPQKPKNSPPDPTPPPPKNK